MSANAITQLQQATREYFASLTPGDAGAAQLAFEQVGRPLDPDDFRPRPGEADAAPPRAAQETARLTNYTMRIRSGVAARTLLSATAVEEFVLAAVAAPGLAGPQLALFEQVKDGIARIYAASRQISLTGPNEYLPVEVDPRHWYEPASPDWTRFSFASSDDPGPDPDPSTTEPDWQFQIAEPQLQAVLDQPAAETKELWVPVVEEQPGPLVDPAQDLLTPVGSNLELAVPAGARFAELSKISEFRSLDPPPRRVPVQGGQITVDFQYELVSVERSWWCAPLLELDSWYVPGLQQGQLSDGRARDNKGSAPTIPVAFLLVRDLRLSGQWSASDQAALQSSIGLGPFSLIGRSVNATTERVEVTVPGCQLIGWICQTLPTLPPASG